ncbi:MAG: hypothetical protein RR310_03420 [Eubacterium sp.]
MIKKIGLILFILLIIVIIAEFITLSGNTILNIVLIFCGIVLSFFGASLIKIKDDK